MSETVYALYPCFKATRRFRELDVDDAAQEIDNLFKEWDGSVAVRGVYSTAGFRADADLMLWLVGHTARTCSGSRRSGNRAPAHY
jgi:chlorite dismutase